jgi:hypothetical protein
VTELFTIEWFGGVAEHHFRKARPEVEGLDWASLDPGAYPATLVAGAREVWTGIALSEYAAIASFSKVVEALTQARAPLDLIGMTSDFLADEVLHVELASRLLMRLGGAAPRPFDPARLAPRPSDALSPFQRANELALRIGCIGEIFAGGTATPMMRETTHALVRSVYERILKDESRHRRFGSLYFEWAADRLDDPERARLRDAAFDTLRAYSYLWKHEPVDAPIGSEWRIEDVHALGWIEPSRYVDLARAVVRDEIVPVLESIGLEVRGAELEGLLA